MNLIEDSRNSGLSDRQFCIKNNISSASFSSAKKRLLSEKAKPSKNFSKAILKSTPISDLSPRCTLVTKGGYSIQLENFNMDYLRRLLEV